MVRAVWSRILKQFGAVSKTIPEGEKILLYFGGDESSRAILGLVKGEF